MPARRVLLMQLLTVIHRLGELDVQRCDVLGNRREKVVGELPKSFVT